MTVNAFTDPEAITLAMVALASIGASISTLEWLANRNQLRPGGLFAWDVIGTRQFLAGKPLRTRVLGRLLAYRRYCLVLLVRVIALAVLPVIVWMELRAAIVILLTVVVATTLLVNLRSPYGQDGSDQMFVQIHLPLLLAFLVGTTLTLKIAIWYIALQACLSYFTSGMAKAVSPMWRGGNVVFRIFNTRTYGYEPVATLLLARPRLTRVVDWSAFTIEMAFPLAIVLGFPAVLFFIAWGVAFHTMNALVMGLNSFFWAFVGTYPAVLYVAAVVSSHSW
jgi:hypothetical protein